MTKTSPRRLRAYLIFGALVALGLAAWIALTALQDNIVFFRSPTEVAENPPAADRRFRIGGMVQEGSVVRDGLDVAFVVTDFNAVITVRYSGMLPDLFREGQGVVAEGRLHPDGIFVADNVLAKHDENYMPPEVAEALQKAGKMEVRP
jgi:cytochrome c-type biogenesis protein CcmE